MNANKRSIAFCALFLTFSLPAALFSAPKSRPELIRMHQQQLENALKGLSKEDRDIIVRDFNQELNSYTNEELGDDNTIGFVKSTIITTYARTKAEQEARKYTPRTEDIDDFAAMWYNNFIATLSDNKSLNGLFDTDLQKAALEHFKKEPYRYIPAPVELPLAEQPKPSAPATHTHSYSPPAVHTHSYSSPVAHTHNHSPAGNNNYQYPKGLHPAYYASSDSDKKRITEGKKELDQIITMLYNKKLTNRTITRFGIFFFKSIQENNKTAVIPPLAHTQNAFVALFEYELEQTKRKLSHEIPSSILDKAVTTTRETLLPQIRQFTPQTAEKFQCALNALEDTIIDNAGIACPICTETYKQEDVFGTVDKVTLQSPYSGYPCHSICKTCAKNGSLNNCPQCRGTIDKQDLRQKVSQPDNPANWRP